MTSNTTAAREAARHDDGRFGEQQKSDPGTDMLTDPKMTQEAAIDWIREDVYTASHDLVATAFRSVGVAADAPVTPDDVAAARKWLRSQALIDASERELDRHRDQLLLARQRAGMAAVKTVTARLRQFHADQLDTIRAVRGDDGSIRWEVRDHDGQMLPSSDEVDQLLASYDPLIDFDNPMVMHSVATGRRWDGKPPAGVEYDENGQMSAVEVAWRQM